MWMVATCLDLGLCIKQLFWNNQSRFTRFARKNVANTLSVANMITGLSSIFFSFNGKCQGACWLLLLGFLLDLADGAVARQLNTCSTLGAKMDDFADFTTFGIATALLLQVDGLLSGLLAIFYVLAVFLRLCFYSTGIPFTYRGLPCPYAGSFLASVSLLTSSNVVILRSLALLMMLFMVDQSYYPHDKVLESQRWKKVVFAGGVFMLIWSSLDTASFYFLTWATSYIIFPTALWGRLA
ncbi:transmembrane protein 269 [Ornithorhynchus anatinus]|uniref:Transmembrane protein 269 n=1 Tax=Ornithorhynchus anatinus TaxID=9258 RepID=F7EFQ3_ORNAN|nr:transmembrane protein 269 [Ornithorhynchus anatinus]XP_028921270.1 transmembrane protein 269 [Ornithorhynchus anatinus]XP_028921271.1 transmembrane protein 269 [Ornithorhynchus anatinus]XP_028921272.1 transmembrane protein 269 [Ornithorhynchus anatinus]